MSTVENVVVALMLMVYMFPEARSKADSSHVIYFTKVCGAVNGGYSTSSFPTFLYDNIMDLMVYCVFD